MDTVIIEALELETIVGIYGWEQQAPRRLILDLELGTDIQPAAASDHIRDALDYQAISEELTALLRDRRFQLIETVAETVARYLFQNFAVQSLRLTVGKPGAVPATRTVAVRIERKREDYAACGR